MLRRNRDKGDATPETPDDASVPDTVPGAPPIGSDAFVDPWAFDPDLEDPAAIGVVPAPATEPAPAAGPAPAAEAVPATGPAPVQPAPAAPAPEVAVPGVAAPEVAAVESAGVEPVAQPVQAQPVSAAPAAPLAAAPESPPAPASAPVAPVAEPSVPVAEHRASEDHGLDDAAIVAAVRLGIVRAQATGEGTRQLERRIQDVELAMAQLSDRLDLRLEALQARIHTPGSVAAQLLSQADRIEQLATSVHQRTAQALEARQAIDGELLSVVSAAAADAVPGESVAWTDVLFLTHELRSRLDDLEGQQRRAIEDLDHWRGEVRDQIESLQVTLAGEVRRAVEDVLRSVVDD